MNSFDYKTAYSRNLGLLTQDEQSLVSQLRIGIAGMGGVGSEYLISLLRIGFQNFKICDIDNFELVNFNRQFGANINSLNKKKTETMKSMALAINPDCNICVYDKPISQNNVKDFIQDCDLVIDGMDFFVLDAHQILIEECQNNGLVVLASVPLGFGAGFLAFNSTSMNFENYFRFDLGKSMHEKALLFALGFGVGAHQIKYMPNKAIKIKEKSGPSIISGIKACTGFITTATLQALLWPHELKLAPWAQHLDFRRRKFTTAYLPQGNSSLKQKFKFHIAKKKYLNC